MVKSETSHPGRINILLLVLIISISFNNIFSQTQFGQNKVQYKEFQWKYLQTKHFDIYFAQGGDDIAQFAAVTAESSLVKLTNNINYEIQHRIPVIIYNSHNEFQQNNVLDEYLPEGVGGVTELFKNRINVPFEGDYEKFRHVIHHELLHAYMNDIYYGGSLQNIITRNIRLQFPIWFNEGQAEFQSLGGNDKANDEFIRDAVMYDYLPPIEFLNGYLAYRGGQSFFAWLSDTYGKEKIGDLFYQIKAAGNVDEGFEEVYKMNLEQLNEKWHKYLKQTYWPDIATRQEVTDFANRITDARKGDGFYNTAPSISPKGDKIAFISNRDDYFDVFIADIKTHKVITKLVEGNRTANFEELHLLTPGLCWSPDGKRIAISVKSGSHDAIYVFNVNTDDEVEIPVKFDGIFAMNWNPKSNVLVFQGDNSRQSDIILYDLDKKKLTHVTDDIFSDYNPTWSNDGTKIYFTSDRGDYTDLKNIPQGLKMKDHDYSNRDLYVYDMNTENLSKFNHDDFSESSNVLTSPDGKKVLYLSDKNGIKNIWLRDLETGEERPITNSIDAIELMSLSADGKRLAFSALNRGGYDLFYIENPFLIDLKIKTLQNTVFVQKLLDEKNKTKPDSLLTKSDSLKKSDSTTALSKDTAKISSDSGLVKNDTSVYGKDIALNLKKENPDTLKENSKRFRLKQDNSKFKITDNLNDDGSFKVRNYKIKFSPDIIYSNANYSSFYGVQGVAQLAFSDMLGNHRIYVATSLVLDLKNSDYAFAYYYLPKRINFGFEGFHSARFLLISNDLGATYQLYRFRQYGANVSASYPFTKFTRVDGTISYAHVQKDNLDDPTFPSQNLDFVLPIVSYVHDNSLWGYTAPIRGTRYNLTLLGTPKIGSNGVSFFSAIADFRHYIKIADDYNIAWRLNTGASLGPNPQKFYAGGTENWINYSVSGTNLPIEDIKDFAFATPILPLRGYDYNAAFGSKFVLMNTEFRFPLFRYLVFGALPIAFQNIQAALFTDVAAVWTNNKQLQLFQRDDNGTLMTKDLLWGMGMGTRIVFLGFPVKLDVAWSYDLKKFSVPKYYISLGTDF